MKPTTLLLAALTGAGALLVTRSLLPPLAPHRSAARQNRGGAPGAVAGGRDRPGAAGVQNPLSVLALIARNPDETPRVFVDVPDRLSPLQELVINSPEPEVQRSASRIRNLLSYRAYRLLRNCWNSGFEPPIRAKVQVSVTLRPDLLRAHYRVIDLDRDRSVALPTSVQSCISQRLAGQQEVALSSGELDSPPLDLSALGLQQFEELLVLVSPGLTCR